MLKDNRTLSELAKQYPHKTHKALITFMEATPDQQKDYIAREEKAMLKKEGKNKKTL